MNGTYLLPQWPATKCPTGYEKIMNRTECEAGLRIPGGPNFSYGSLGCLNSSWPAQGCFLSVITSKAYYSTCPANSTAFYPDVKYPPVCKKVATCVDCDCTKHNASTGHYSQCTLRPRSSCTTYCVKCAPNATYIGRTCPILATTTSTTHYHHHMTTATTTTTTHFHYHTTTAHMHFHTTTTTQAKYTMGTQNTDGCPTGYEKITTASSCTSAASALGLSFTATENKADFPGGCYRLIFLGLPQPATYFNTHAGQPSNQAQPICIQASKYLVADGCDSRGASVAAYYASPNASVASARCCSTDGGSCTTPEACSDMKKFTMGEATSKCAAIGRRLCTEAELGSGTCCGTGGN